MTVRPITPAVGAARADHHRAQAQGLHCDAGCLVCLRARELATTPRATPAPRSGASTCNTPPFPWSYRP